MVTQFGMGYRPSPIDKVGLGHPEHLRVSVGTVLPQTADVYYPPPVDQGQTSSCTGNSTATAIQEGMTRGSVSAADYSSEVASGSLIWTPLPSRLFLYYQARAIIAETDQDAGAMIADIFEGARLLGVCPEDAWQFVDLNETDPQKILMAVTAQPDPMAYHRAADQRLVNGAWRILTNGPDLIQDVMSAIAAGNPVVWGTLLDQPFTQLEPSDVWPGVRSQVIGGHAMVMHAYRTVAGRIHFKTRSSWGQWCDGGSAWVHQDAITSANASDFWVVSTTPTYTELPS